MPAKTLTGGQGWTAAVNGLRPFAKPPDWLTALSDPPRVVAALASGVPELAAGESGLKACEVRQMRIKKDGLSALYRLEFANDGQPARVVDLRGRFVPPGLSEPDVATNGARLGSAGWQCWIPELRLQLGTEPFDDPALPALSRLRDPEEARVLLEGCIRGSSPRYADLRIEGCSPRVARYNRGSRCTVVYQLRFPHEVRPLSWPETVVAKVHHGAKGRNAYESMQALWGSDLRRSRSVTIAEPLAFISGQNILIQAGIPHERTLREFLSSTLGAPTAQSADELVSYLAKAAAALADLHGCGVRPPTVVTFDEELAAARTALARLGRLLPELADTATPLLVCLEAHAQKHPADPLCPAHRSFRPAQILLNGRKIALIDFDGFCLAEPAIDVALFRAIVKDIGLRSLQAKEGKRADGRPRVKHLTQLDELCEAFSASYEAAASVSRRRVALWEALYLLTLVIHSWTKGKFDSLDGRLGLLRRHLRSSELSG
jgi:hypothetical protein